eukprot:scaffold59581_cov54-Attheya_sp.AAC.1
MMGMRRWNVLWMGAMAAFICGPAANNGMAMAQKDLDPNCADWAEQGECENNPNFMLKNCELSCDRISGVSKKEAELLDKIPSFYDMAAKDIDGNMFSFDQLRGKVAIIVNVASYCGYTESHYAGLVKLHKELAATEAVEILAFPCNQFGAQEPDDPSDIKEFAMNKGVEFRMMDKVDVNGPNASIVYKYLKYKSGGPKTIEWNFATYFVVAPD